MSLSIYAVSVPVFAQILSALDRILDKAIAYAADRKIAPEALLSARLFPDMLPFSRQVQLATDHARNSSARLAGLEPPRVENTETSFEELKGRVAKTIDFLRGLNPDGFEGAEDRKVTYAVRGQPVEAAGLDYLLRSALPNFFFHATTAYDILRHNGLEIGKRDFLGSP